MPRTRGEIRVRPVRNEKVRLCLDFPNRAAMDEWVQAQRQVGALPEDGGAFKMDGLDQKSTSVTPGRTYVYRRATDRVATEARS